MDPLTLGVIIGNRDVFPGELAKSGRRELLEALMRQGISAVVLPEDQTEHGAVRTLAEARKYAELFRANSSRIDGVLVSLPNFGDERAIADTLRMSGLDVPALVHAFPDEIGRMGLHDRRDSFCGKLSVCNVLKQYGISFSITPRHTVPVSSPEFVENLDWFGAVCRVTRGIRSARIGAIGARVAPFKTVRYSEKLLERSGISVDTVDLSEILTRMEKLDGNAGIVVAKTKALSEYSDTACVHSDALTKLAKLGAVIDEWIQENQLQAVAIQCWPAMQGALHIFPCLLMSLLNNSLIPAACETDVPGAVSAYALRLASGSPSVLMDWNNNYGDDPDKAVIFHCSNVPVCMMTDAKTSYNPIAAKFAGADNSYATTVGRLKSGPFTFTRVSTDDTEGAIKAYVGEGEFTDDPLDSFGAVGVARIEGLQQLLQRLCRSGFEHHVAISRSQTASVLSEAMGNYLGWDVYHHNCTH